MKVQDSYYFTTEVNLQHSYLFHLGKKLGLLSSYSPSLPKWARTVFSKWASILYMCNRKAINAVLIVKSCQLQLLIVVSLMGSYTKILLGQKFTYVKAISDIHGVDCWQPPLPMMWDSPQHMATEDYHVNFLYLSSWSHYLEHCS